MSELFILQNHDKLFWGRQKEWLDGRDPASLFKTPHKDEAVNQVFEISSKDYTQRIKVVSCKTNEKGLPVIEAGLLPTTQPANASLFDEADVPAENAISLEKVDHTHDDEDASDDDFRATTTADDPDELEEIDEPEAEDSQRPLL